MLQSEIELLQQTRKPTDERKQKLKKLNLLKEQEKELDLLLNQNKANNPEQLKSIQQQIGLNKQAVNRWTDNTWTVKQFLVKKKGMSGKEVDKLLKIGETFDYVN